MNVTFYKTKNGNNSYTAAEVNTWGVFDFRMRLGLSLNDTVDRATVLILGMPVTEAGQRELPGFEEPGDISPHICIEQVEVALGPLHARNTGQPLRVFVHHVQETVPEWDPREMWTAIRELMANPLHANCLQVEDWHRDVAGPRAPEMPELRQTNSWPSCPEGAAVAGDDANDGKYLFLCSVLMLCCFGFDG